MRDPSGGSLQRPFVDPAFIGDLGCVEEWQRLGNSDLRRRPPSLAVLASSRFMIAVANGRVCVIEKRGGTSSEWQGHLSDRRIAERKDHGVCANLALGEPVEPLISVAVARQSSTGLPIMPGAPNRVDAGGGCVERIALAKSPHTQRMNGPLRHGCSCSQTADILTIPCSQ